MTKLVIMDCTGEQQKHSVFLEPEEEILPYDGESRGDAPETALSQPYSSQTILASIRRSPSQQP